jgi:hypothetical protein
MEVEYTFKENQSQYRLKLKDFFSQNENYIELKRFLDKANQIKNDKQHPLLWEIIVHYITKQNAIIIPEDKSIPPIKLEHLYRLTIQSQRKRFFNFLCDSGTGDLIWESERNPLINPSHELGVECESLPRLLAIKFMIMNRSYIDFWNNYANIRDLYIEYKLKTNKRYQKTHQLKLKELKEFAIDEIKKIRVQKQQSKQQSIQKRNVIYTRKEREKMRNLMKEKNDQIHKERVIVKRKRSKRKNKRLENGMFTLK